MWFSKRYRQPIPSIQGWMLPNELQWLYEQAKKMNSIVEVGSWKGKSTHALLSGCKGKVYTIDTFKGSPSEIDLKHKEAALRDIERQLRFNLRKFKNLEIFRVEIATVDFFYDLFDGGYLNPEDLLEDKEDIKRVKNAVESIREFRSSCNDQIEEFFQ